MKTLDKITAFCGNCKRQTIQEIRRDDTYEGEESAYYKCWRVCLTCYRDFDYPMTKPVLELTDKEFDEITEPLVQVVESLKARVKDLEEEIKWIVNNYDQLRKENWGAQTFGEYIKTQWLKRKEALEKYRDEMQSEKNYKWKPGDPVWPPDKQTKKE